MRRALAVATLLVAVACSAGADRRFGGRADTEPPAFGGLPGGAANISLTIRVEPEPGARPRDATLDCNPAPHGTGFLEDRLAAENACHFLIVHAGAQRRLRDGPDPLRACTEIYGGPQIATVRGQLYGEPVDARFTRADGCGIADWDVLEPLLGAP